MSDKPELVSTLTGYAECRCILSQYCDGKCRPIYQLKPTAHLTIPGALEWDQLPGPVEIEYPEYSEQGMGCGLEDRGITDRYEAMRYGYDEALDQFARILDGYGPLYAHAGTHGVVGTHSADGEHSESAAAIATLKALGYTHNGGTHWKPPVGQKPDFDLIDSLRTQLASTEQSRRSFFDLSQDLEKRLAYMVEAMNQIVQVSSMYEKPFEIATLAIGELSAMVTAPVSPVEIDPFATTEAPYVPLSAAEVEAFISMGDGNKDKQKACAACDGWGTISTGIDEAPSTNCKECDGTGKGGEQ